MSKQILILGGGYGGLLSALTAREYLTAGEANITIINRYPTHQIITELHRLAAGNVNEQAVALPLQKLLSGKQVNVIVDTVEAILPNEKAVKVASGTTYKYDALVIALGSETAYFGIPGLKENSLTLKSVDEAHRIFETVKTRLATYKTSKNKADATFVIGGGGLTGVELVGEFADELPELCRQYGVDYQDVSLYCVEAGPTILAGFPAELVERATTSLEKRGVKFVTGVPITELKDNKVFLKDGSSIEASTVIWTGGVQGNALVGESGIEVNRGRATVTPTLQSTSHSDIFVAGDSAVVFPEGAERPYPPTAQIAWHMGETIGYNLSVMFKGGTMENFHYVSSGTLGSLGRKDGIATVGASSTRLKGMPASLMKEASNMRYLARIKGLSALVH